MDPGVVAMKQKNVENPYKPVSDPEVEPAKANGERSVLRVAGQVTLALLITIFCISFFSNLDVNRFSSIALRDVVSCTIISGVIATIALPILWAVAGVLCRRKNVPTPTQQEAVIYVSSWIACSVLLFATVPSVIEGFGTHYPVSDYTLNYFLLLALGMSFVVVINFRRYRAEPDQKSAFICCMGGIVVIMAIGMVAVFVVAIMASAVT